MHASTNQTAECSDGPVIFWFRKDLRVEDNTGLYQASVRAATVNGVGAAAAICEGSLAAQTPTSALDTLKGRLGGALVGLYVVCSEQYSRHEYSPAKLDLVFRALAALRERLWGEHRVPLLVLEADSFEQVPAVVAALVESTGATHVHLNIEYELDERRRDDRLALLFKDADGRGRVVASHDECIVPPGAVSTKEGRVYNVFTPFLGAWRRAAKLPERRRIVPSPIPNPEHLITALTHLRAAVADKLPAPTADRASRQVCAAAGASALTSALGPAESATSLHVARANWPASECAAKARLASFAEQCIDTYAVRRDEPATRGTSRLSAYLAVGILSPRQCLATACASAGGGDAALGPPAGGAGAPTTTGATTWVQELAWRDYYRHIVRAHPRICTGRPIKRETEHVKWTSGDDADAHFNAWTEGRTGYPLVDAAMRYLRAHAWLHNRLRMVTATFLCKSLLVDWRRGEAWFMRMLVDGDFASNNGGWQWCASTGTASSQPYFRVFNPVRQSERYDREGIFIRANVPELRSVLCNKAIHDPHARLPGKDFVRLGYPWPRGRTLVLLDRAVCAIVKD